MEVIKAEGFGGLGLGSLEYKSGFAYEVMVEV